MRRLLKAVVGIGVICSPSTLHAVSSPGEVPIGILLPLSGSLQEAGQINLQGHQLALEEINDAGGIRALGGAKLRFMIRDTQGDPTVGRQEAVRLVQDGAIALVGAYQSTVTFPATEVAEHHEVPFLITTALADILTKRGFTYTFRTEPSQTQFVRAQFQFLEENGFNPSSTRIALLYERTLWGQSTANIQREIAQKKGYSIATDIAYPYQLKDLSNVTRMIAEQLKHTTPEVLLLSSYLHDSIQLARAFKSNGIRPKAIICTGAGSKDPPFVQILGKDAESWMVVNEWNVDMRRAGTERLNAAFRQRFGTDMNGIAAVSYVSIWILKEALEKSGSTDGERLRSALASLQVKTGPATILPMGHIAFDEQRNNAAMPIITQIQQGRQRTIWPKELAATRPQFGQYFIE